MTTWEPGDPIHRQRPHDLTRIGDIKATLTEADVNPLLDGVWPDSARWPTPHHWDQIEDPS